MSYVALYRKWRPSQFDEVKGQEHIVTTLCNQIIADRIGHAYLFCGTRGTGKTSVAKLLAKAVNCENPVNGNPCNHCASCRSIMEQTSMNVIEIDAASNTGVDNIREIKDEIQYSPTEGKYKVYIIDEVHMLTTGAFNALLKTLEEPPEYVIFILATTEAHKIPITILSRCQRYDFKRVSIDVITEHLVHLMQEEQIEAEEKALRYVAKVADGSFRDALSLLDKCIAFYFGQSLTYDKVLEVLGAVDTEVFYQFLGYIITGETIKVLNMVDEIVMQGREIGQFVLDFTWYLRNLLLIKGSDQVEDLLDVSTEHLQQLKEQATKISQEDLIRFIRIFSELSNQIKFATQKRILLEVAVIKLCKPEMETDLGSLISRITKLEQLVEQGGLQRVSSEPVSSPEPVVNQVAKQDAVENLKKQFPPAQLAELKEVVTKWGQFKQQANSSYRTFLANTKTAVGADEHSLSILFPSDETGAVAKDFIEGRLEDVKEELSNFAGKEINLQCVLLSKEETASSDSLDISKLINMPIEFEE